MILKQEHNLHQKDIEILITYPEKNNIVDRIVSFIKAIDTEIECYSRDTLKLVSISDIYYVESVDKMAVVFCEKESYRTKYRLYQLYEKLSDKGFVQINKYCILNINKLDKVKPLFNNRMEAILSNKARMYITRKYLPDVKPKLQEGK